MTMTRKFTTFILFAFFFLFVLISTGSGQFSRIGGGLNFSTGIENDEHQTGNPGINARCVIELGEKLWLVPGASFFMPGKRQHTTWGRACTATALRRRWLYWRVHKPLA